MKRSIKALLAFVIAFSMISGLAACGSDTSRTESDNNTTTASADQSTTKQEALKEPVKLTLQTFEHWAGEPGLKAGLAEYEKKTGNKVEVQPFPNDQFHNLIKTKIATGDVPDLIAIWGDRNVLPEDQFADLDGPWAQKINADLAKTLYSRKSDGKLIVGPYAPSSYLGVIYNKKVFEKAGIKAPINSYSELMAACEAIKKIGVTPVEFANKEGHIAQIFWFIGGQPYMFDKLPEACDKIRTNKAKMKDVPEFVELLKRINSLKEKGYINSNYMSETSSEAAKAVAEGKAGMSFLSDWFINDLQNTAPDKIADTGIMPATFADDYIAISKSLNVESFWVPKDGKQVEAAKEFVNTMLSDEMLKVIYAAQPGPSIYSGMETPMNAWQKEMYDYEKTIPVSLGQLTNFPEGLIDTGKYFQDYMAGKPLDKLLDDWYVETSKQFKAKGVEGW